ncbi:hypothetical protein PM082_008619 [Marasmius tenuissimus]|nr:hypothetical protein PM082_008619 [Marasmius tenuissimus]
MLRTNSQRETFIGANQDVKVDFVTCPGPSPQLLAARQTPPTNVCGTQCKTNCFTPSGGGPDPNECDVIANALRFDSENTETLHMCLCRHVLYGPTQFLNTAPIFPIGTGTNNTVAMTFRSCKTFFVNQNLGDLAYCRTDWTDVLDFATLSCQATQNAHGSNCVATDQRWFVQ